MFLSIYIYLSIFIYKSNLSIFIYMWSNNMYVCMYLYVCIHTGTIALGGGGAVDFRRLRPKILKRILVARGRLHTAMSNSNRSCNLTEWIKVFSTMYEIVYIFM